MSGSLLHRLQRAEAFAAPQTDDELLDTLLEGLSNNELRAILTALESIPDAPAVTDPPKKQRGRPPKGGRPVPLTGDRLQSQAFWSALVRAATSTPIPPPATTWQEAAEDEDS